MAGQRQQENGGVARLLARPQPPEDLISPDALSGRPRFVPAPDLTGWLTRAYLDEDGPLHDPDHAHLRDANIGCLWTNAENSRQQRRIVGQAEMPANSLGRMGKWQKARCFQQIEDWFGDIPDFLLTFDACHAAEIDDATFCALVDHELRHCGQEMDEYGSPKFHRDGSPCFAMKAHDVEEFIGVIRRFGINAAGPEARAFFDAAKGKPEIAPARLGQACGTCMARAA